MSQCVIAVTGISGVGKTSLLRELSSRVNFQHMQASALIKAARSTVAPVLQTDELRQLGIGDNQQLLVGQFRREINSSVPLVVVDAHTLIELPGRTELIQPCVFKDLGVSAMLFLIDEAEAIAQRRRSDNTRKRPLKEAKEISLLQLEAEAQAARICRALGIPIKIFDRRSGQIPVDFFRL